MAGEAGHELRLPRGHSARLLRDGLGLLERRAQQDARVVLTDAGKAAADAPPLLIRYPASKPNQAQMAVLENLFVGRPADAGLEGMSAHGGLSGTLRVLLRRKLVLASGEITEAGRFARLKGLA